MTNCPSEITLQSYLDGELGQLELQEITHHVEHCLSCRQTLLRMQRVHSLLSAAAPIAAPDDLRQQIQAAVAFRGEGLPCEQAREMVLLSLDEQLSESQLTSLEGHLDECEDCRFYADRMAILVRGLRQVPDVPTPKSLHRRIEAAVEKADTKSVLSLRHLITTWAPRRMTAVAGLAAAAAIMIALVMQYAGVSWAPRDVPISPSQIVAEAPITPSQATDVLPAPDATAISDAPVVQSDIETAPPATVTSGLTATPGAAPDTTTVSRRIARATQPTQPARATRPPIGARTAMGVSSQSAHMPSDTAAVPTATQPETAVDVQTVVSSSPVATAPLIEGRPVDIVRRSEVSVPPASRVVAARTDLSPDPFTPSARPATPPEPQKPSRPVSSGATLAKASPRTPPTLRTAESTTTETAGPTRLASASASWLPVHEATRSVYSAPPADSSRLTTASERISRELGDLKQAPTTPAIVVIK
jgi:predicted anti-sigma-YlaC factor YlaD